MGKDKNKAALVRKIARASKISQAKAEEIFEAATATVSTMVGHEGRTIYLGPDLRVRAEEIPHTLKSVKSPLEARGYIQTPPRRKEIGKKTMSAGSRKK